MKNKLLKDEKLYLFKQLNCPYSENTIYFFEKYCLKNKYMRGLSILNHLAFLFPLAQVPMWAT